MAFNLDKNYINTKLKLPDTNTVVILNGEYQAELSDLPANLTFEKNSINIAQNTVIENQLHLLFIASQDCTGNFNIIVGKNSLLTIIEEFISLDGNEYTNNLQITITAEDNSKITHFKLQTENITGANHQTKTVIKQAKDSKITSTIINRGGKTSKDSLQVLLNENGAEFNIDGINMLTGSQNMTQHIRIEHLAPNCTSNILVKGVLDDQATDNFDCRVIAHPKATKTETHVTNKNLLLSEKATANTAPELEVYVDDVICTHGATVGQLDNDAIFYLRSRGISKNGAEKLLTAAFVQEITAKFLNYDRFKTAIDLNYEQ